MIHHSALSFRKLRSMKILDRLSVFIVALQDHIVDQEKLVRPELFGQFGTITSIRILQETNPPELYVRFEEESSAAAAIAWCKQRELTFKDVKHGYQKYCIKFINKQKCRKPCCPNRHSWAPTKDILTFADTRLFAANNAQSAAFEREQPQQSPSREKAQLAALEREFAKLQQEFDRRTRCIDDMVSQLNQMQLQNSMLKATLRQQHGIVSPAGSPSAVPPQHHLFLDSVSSSLPEIVDEVIAADTLTPVTPRNSAVYNDYMAPPVPFDARSSSDKSHMSSESQLF